MNNNNFIERSIMGALSFLKDSVFTEEFSSKKGFLQLIEPHIKVASTLFFLVTAALIKNINILLILYTFCLLLSLLSGINIVYFLKRTWFFIPIFALFIAFPAIFSLFSPGETLLSIKLFSKELNITRQGLNGAVLFVMRVTVTISFAVLMVLTTRHSQILSSLSTFKVPQVFILISCMCYRYIYYFIETIENTYLAIKSRTGAKVDYKKGQKIVAWNIAYLWQRSYYLSQQIYDAMLSRGFSGEEKCFDNKAPVIKDWSWLIFSCILCIFLLHLDNKWKI